MDEQKFPKGWDAERVKRPIAETEAMSEAEQVAADEAVTATGEGHTIISVPERGAACHPATAGRTPGRVSGPDG